MHVHRMCALAILAIAVLLVFSGCSVGDFLNRDVDVDHAKAKVADLQALLTATTDQLGQIKGQLAQAKVALEASGSEQAAKVVATLERSAAYVEQTLPTIQAAVTKAQATVNELEVGGKVPLWQVLVGAAVPFLLPLAKGIPGVGPIVGTLGEMAWNAYATAQQRERQAKVEAQAKALPYQVAVTHEALLRLPDGVAENLTTAAKREQKVAGVHAVIADEVLKLEAAEDKRAA